MRTFRASSLLLTLLVLSPTIRSQDLFPVTRLTTDSTREGFPSWSPDGKTIVYSFFDMAGDTMIMGSRKIPVESGASVLLTDYPTEHPQWSPDGRFIVFDADTGSAIRMISAEGGPPIAFLPDSIRVEKGGLPCWSPDGSKIAFKDGVTSSLFVYDVATKVVVRALQEVGKVVLPGCWTRDGKSILVAVMDTKTRLSTLWRIAEDGSNKEQIRELHEGFYRYVALSPDGTLLVYGAVEGRRVGLWIMLADGGLSLPFAVSQQYHNEAPAWSPDGTRVAIASGRTGRGDIYLMEIDTEEIKTRLNSRRE